MSKERTHFYAPSGSMYADNHAVRIDDHGHKTLVKDGTKTNTYEVIQSYADECDIEQIIKRAQALEDPEILNRAQGIYGDITSTPKSLLEAAQMLQDAENEFNELPIDIRRNFNFNFNEYIAAASNDKEDDFMRKMSIQQPEPEPESTPAPETKGGEE